MTAGRLCVERPDWPAPAAVAAASTLRVGGVSGGPYTSLNLGDHVGDDPRYVAANRARLRSELALPGAPLWLNQVHGSDVARDIGRGSGPDPHAAAPPRADAAVTTAPGRVLAILTADCLPVLLCRRDGTAVGAAHAGWRSLAGGVLENTVAALGGDGAQLLAWLGPAIGPRSFEVGQEVRAIFVNYDPQAAAAFHANRPGHYLADLFLLARQRLARLGVVTVCGGGMCTYRDPARFFSFRRDGQCGRMATLVWLASTDDVVANA